MHNGDDMVEMMVFDGSMDELADFLPILVEAAARHAVLTHRLVAEALASPCEVGKTEVMIGAMTVTVERRGSAVLVTARLPE
jgi:hypothetical protein